MSSLKILKFFFVIIISLSVLSCSSSEVASDQSSNQDYELIFPKNELKAPSEYSKELTPVWETWAYLTKDYVERSSLNEEKMTELLIKEMLNSLDDQHSNYIPPEFFNVENTDMQGKYQGIGASVDMNRAGKVVIVSPFVGSPAKKAGILPGDIILEVDGISLEGYSLMEAINLIRGPEGTVVELLVKHLLTQKTELISIKRESIKLDSVNLRSEKNDNIAHIRLTNFYPESGKDLSQMITEVKNNGAKAILLDLRNNPGGLLSSVIDVTSLFLEQGIVMKEIDGYNREKIWNIRDLNYNKHLKIPIVVLINNYSASASEVLAGALKDYKRAIIVGEKSFGKGSVGLMRPLSNGGGISMTIAKWYTPNGNIIHEVGVQPDVIFPSQDATDTTGIQTDAAKNHIRNNILNIK